MRYLVASVLTIVAVASPFRAIAVETPASIAWPTFAELNRAYDAHAVREANGFRLEYRVGDQTFVKKVAVPAELWGRMKADFKPRQADVVISKAGELSSVEIREKGRELWITFDRRSSKCLEMIYPSGRGIGDLTSDFSANCGG